MQVGFFDHTDISYPMHSHPFAEMHVFLSGNAVLLCDKDDVRLKEADVLCVPANTPHKYEWFDKDAKRITFLIDRSDCLKAPLKTCVTKDFLSLLCNEIREYVLAGKDSKLKPLLSYISSDFFVSKQIKSMTPIANRALIIEEFFAKNYNTSVSLEDLAEKLMLSSKQASREVKRITGNTFVDELTKRRMNAAVVLTQTTNLSLSKISELVGYSSYCGFYKACKRTGLLKP